MAKIFISYKSEDEDKTKALVDDIEKLGYTVWFDRELSGGQKWWDTILESIRDCDMLVFALSVESLNSSACSREYDYASKLGKTILPVLVGENVSINLLPPVLSQIQFVDYRDPDRDALLHLAKALTSAPPSQPLPNPLPLPPEVPISYLGKLGKQISNTSKLSYEEQSTLLVDLKRGLHDPETAADTRTLLKKLRKRQYLFENIAKEIDELLEDTVPKKSVRPQVSETEQATPKKNQSQEIKSEEVDKNSFWTSLPGIMTGFVIIVAIVTGLYFASIGKIPPTDQVGYVCYDKKIEGNDGEVFYKGCKIYETSCISNSKEHFGKYPTKSQTEDAYVRCINGTPQPVPEPAQPKNVLELVQHAKAYYYGTQTIAKDYTKAKDYFLRAANENSIDAYRYLGTIYLFGHGAAVNKEEAKRWLQMAIASGDMRAQEIYNKYISPSDQNTSYTKYKVVNVASNDTLNVRTNPFVEPNNKVGELQPYARDIRILECKANYKGVQWCKIESYEGGYALRGWVVGRCLAPQNPPKTSSNLYHVINIRSDDTLAVRNGPGTQYYKTGDLPYNASGVQVGRCRYSSKGGKWCVVNYANIEGWASAIYLRRE
ncbi:TIR domain-containing protein [Sulfurovum sp.]|uniref:TIR domain-containing protein n=1 Tax=Sulfurovum sp. TaxID=1969726 RepID=UPI0025E056F7|nr:TIR domain-containing protein [Sulfurovum sp.]